MKIKNLRVWNFRSIGSDRDEPGIDVPLKPLTIFVGPNASGKSSILYSILWMKLKENLRLLSSEESNLFGINSYEDLASGRNLEKWIGVELTFDISDVRDELKLLFEEINWEVCGIIKPKVETLTYGFRIKKNVAEEIDYELCIKLDGLEFTFRNVYDPLKETYSWSLKGSLEAERENSIMFFSVTFILETKY